VILEGARVLMVEDHADLAANIKELLEGEGADVRVAQTAAEGLELAKKPYDVALIDVRLPDTSGLEVLHELKSNGESASEVLLVTGNATLEDAIDAVGAGAYAYLLKPFHPEDLLRCVAQALGQVNLKREADALATRLEQSEANLRTMVNTVQALLLVLDEDGIVLQANPAVAAATGIPVREIVGASWVENFVPETDHGALVDVFDRLVGGEKNVCHENRIIARGPGGEPTERWVQWRSSPLRDSNGNLHIYASGMDITETRELERRSQVARRLAAVGTMTAGLAHEVRNPLNSARLQLHVLQRRLSHLKDDPKYWNPIELALEEIERLARLLTEFLDFARPPEVRMNAVDMRDVVTRVFDLEQPHARELSIELTKQIPDEPMLVTGDPDKLQQAVINIVQNAMEALSGGGHIELRVHNGSNQVHVIVKDDGPGIPDDDVARIFEPFFSTKPQGTGLGMAICHNLISQHGGVISVRSNGGAEFDVAFPRRAP
jgi:PAS domain S-box-containing protein